MIVDIIERLRAAIAGIECERDTPDSKEAVDAMREAMDMIEQLREIARRQINKYESDMEEVWGSPGIIETLRKERNAARAKLRQLKKDGARHR